MRILRNKNNKKLYVIITVAALILSGGVAAALFIPASPFSLNKSTGDQPENTVNYDDATDEQKEAGDKIKEEFINNHQDDESTDPDGNIDTKTVGVTITTPVQQSSVLQIRTIIETLDNSGLCTLSLSRIGQEGLVKTAQTQSQGSYSVCKGFDIDTSSLQKGEWMVTVDYKGQNKVGSATKVVNIE